MQKPVILPSTDDLPPITLASASPRRKELLEQAAIPFTVLSVDVDEDAIHSDDGPEASALLRAEAKAAACRALQPEGIILAADTRVIVDGRALDKATDEDDARAMLKLLSGRRHSVVTGIVVTRAGAVGQETTLKNIEETKVQFSSLSDGEIAWYLDTGEWRGVAGAYRIQGLAARFIPAIRGSYSNVVGLPIATVYSMVSQFR